jgi:hypothetical protein
MKRNTKITGNYAEYGGGVYVKGGDFTMLDSAMISGNYGPSSNGGGVYMYSTNPQVTMSGERGDKWQLCHNLRRRGDYDWRCVQDGGGERDDKRQ